ncbi:class I SAM-dependent methyltransferase [Streptomyces sp. NPDC057381]|uniref:class I SAM-dependent methyltransferase n=1 Tax=unclassified Streptomyces TaxID=2593676 RepID=UPI003632C085
MTFVAAPRRAEAWNSPAGAHWAAHRAGYDARPAGVDDALFGAAAIVPGDRVLVVGCGAGATTRIAARLAAPGQVVGVDVCAPPLERARADTAAEGVENACYVCADAQAHPFPAGAYDVVVGRGGPMSLAGHAAALRDAARALRPGGRLAFVCPRPPGPHREDPERVRETIREALAGFAEVRVVPVTVESSRGRDVPDAVEFLLSPLPGGALPASRLAGPEEVLLPFAAGRGARALTGVWLVTAVRP